MDSNTCQVSQRKQRSGDEVDLKIELIKQPAGSMLCGLACMEMITKYMKSECPEARQVFEKGALETSIALVYLANGLNSVVFQTPDGEWLPNKYADMKPDEVVRSLRIRKLKLKNNTLMTQVFEEIADALEQDVLRFKIPSRELIEANLRQGNPWIVGVNPHILHSTPEITKDNPGHFVVVSGFDKDSFIVNDPCPKKGGTIKVQKDRLMFAMFDSTGAAVCVSGRRKFVEK